MVTNQTVQFSAMAFKRVAMVFFPCFGVSERFQDCEVRAMSSRVLDFAMI